MAYNMSKERAEMFVKVFQGLAEGKEMQERWRDDPWREFDGALMIDDDGYTYRIKPDEPREYWLCWDDVKDQGRSFERPDARVYPTSGFEESCVNHWKHCIKVREVVDEG